MSPKFKISGKNYSHLDRFFSGNLFGCQFFLQDSSQVHKKYPVDQFVSI